jgi:hypothetical protein
LIDCAGNRLWSFRSVVNGKVVAAEARALLLNHADAVRRVADASILRETICGAEIDRLIGR